MNKRVLILDDDEDFNHLLTDIYGQADYEVISEHDPEVALKRIKDETFDVIVTDQKMPGLSGEEFIREVKAVIPDQPIIMVSGYLDNDTIRRLIKEGVGGVYLKPLNVFSLLKRTTALIEEREMGKRRSAGTTDEQDSTEPEAHNHGLPFPFKSLPCRSQASLDFANRLYSLRNFKSNLIIIAPPGSDLDAIIMDLAGFDQAGAEAFTTAQSQDLNDTSMLDLIEKSIKTGANRTTIFIKDAELITSDQKKVIFAAASNDSPFDTITQPLRFIFHVSRDLDELYDAGQIDDDLYMFMGTSEIQVPALDDIADDITLLAQRYLNEEATQRNREPTPELDAPARAYLRDTKFTGNALELKKLMAGAMDLGVDTIGRDELAEAVERMHAATRGRSLNLRHELESFRTDMCAAMLQFCAGDASLAAKLLEIPQTVFDKSIEPLSETH